MKKKVTKITLSLIIVSLFLISTPSLAFAADKNNDGVISNDMILIDTELINPDLPMDSQSYYLPQKVLETQGNEIQPMANTIYPGATNSDYNYFGPNNKGKCYIYSKVDTTQGFWSGVFFDQFSGHGQTSWSSTVTPTKNTSEVKVKAVGAIPLISHNGTKWSILSSTRTVGQTTTNTPSAKDTKSYYYNVKVQAIGGLTVIFTNSSYLSLPGLGGHSSSEDVWWW